MRSGSRGQSHIRGLSARLMTSKAVSGWKSGTSSSWLPSKKRLLNPGPSPARALCDICSKSNHIGLKKSTLRMKTCVECTKPAHLLQSHVIEVQLFKWPPQRFESIRSDPTNWISGQPEVSEVPCLAQCLSGHLPELISSQVNRVQVTCLVKSPGRHMLNGIPGEIESSQTLSPRHDTWLQFGDGVVLQMKCEQTGYQFEDTFGEAGKAVLFQMEVSQLRETLKKPKNKWVWILSEHLL